MLSRICPECELFEGLKIINIGFGDSVESISFRREDSSKIEGRFKESFMHGLARRLVQTASDTFLTNFQDRGEEV